MPKDLLSPYRPCFQHFANMPALPLWELIALSCNLDPGELEKQARPGDRNYPSYVGSIYLYQDFAPKRQSMLSIIHSVQDFPFTKTEDTVLIDLRYVDCEKFHQWSIKHNVALPEGFPWATEQLDIAQDSKREAGSPSNSWKASAIEIAATILQNSPTLSIDKLAQKTHVVMVNRKNEPGMTGRGGRVPTAATIKRHALTGIKT